MERRRPIRDEADQIVTRPLAAQNGPPLRTSAASAMGVGAQIALLACLLSNLKGCESSAVLILAKQTQRPKKAINQRVCGLCAASAGPRRAIRLTLCALGRCLNGAQTAESNENI
jgi:hypothetical protein